MVKLQSYGMKPVGPWTKSADVPFRIYSGNIAVADAGFEIALQLGWTAVLVGAGYLVYIHVRSRLVVQGG